MKKLVLLALTVSMVIPAVVFGAGRRAVDSGSSTGGPVEITWFQVELNQPNIQYWKNTAWVKELERRFNVNLVFQGPLEGSYDDAVNVMLASGDYPNIITWNWNNYRGGLEQAVKDNVAIAWSTNDAYKALLPNMLGIINSNPNIRREVSMGDGTIAFFPQFEDNPNRNGYEGLFIRQDWLDRVGIQKLPSTIDEYHAALLAFKQQDANGNGDPNDEIPFADSGRGWGRAFPEVLAAWGLKINQFYQDPQNPGKMIYWTQYKNGAAFTDALTTWARWYQEGLIDPDWSTQNSATFTAKVTNDQVGSSHAFPSSLKSYRDALVRTKPELDGNVRFVGLPRLTGPDGKAYINSNGLVTWIIKHEAAVITPKSRQEGKVEQILRMFDYMYSPEGTLLMNFGVEGQSFTRDAQGNYQWLDVITKDPDFTPNQKLFEFTMHTNARFPKIMSYEGWKLGEFAGWADAATAHERNIAGDKSLLIDEDLPLYGAEAEEYAAIMNDINTASSEFYPQVINGRRSVSDIPAFISQLERMNLRRAQAIYQAAYDRYMKK
jgi:putative aldouronate transport system substrate-binding protein